MKARCLLCLFGTIGVLVVSALTYDYVMDDALITLRYSENLAGSGLPIWNKADVSNPTMGYTSTTWMVVNSITALFTDDKDVLILFTKIYSFAAALLFLVFVSNWLVDSAYTVRKGLFLIFAFFWNPVIGLHINSGMETVLFGVLVFTFAYLILSNKNYYLILAIGFICYLTRPEGGVIVLLFWVVDYLQKKNLSKSIFGAAILGALLLGYHFALWRFYGDVLPTPFYAKQATGSLLKLSALKESIMFLILSALPFLTISILGGRSDWSRLKVVFLFQAVLFSFFLTVKPMMNVAYRYQVPILFLLYLTSMIAYRGFARFKLRAHASVYLLVAFQWMFNLGVSDMYTKKMGRAAENLKQIGRAFMHKNDGVHWMAYGDAGFVCFYSGFNTIDLVGLNNKQIAKNLLSQEDVLRNPKVRIVLKNAEFEANDEIEPRFDLEAFGLSYVGSIPMTRDSRKKTVVQCYTRDAFIAPEDLNEIRTDPDYEKSGFETVYYLGRKIIKAR